MKITHYKDKTTAIFVQDGISYGVTIKGHNVKALKEWYQNAKEELWTN